jgi:hypothetical protein
MGTPPLALIRRTFFGATMARGRQAIPLIGKQFGRLTVLARAHTSCEQIYWTCICECETICIVCGSNLRSGHTQSCGCFRIDTNVERLTTHGHARKSGKSVEYTAWQNMMKRCYYPKHNRFKHYGGRGIYVCVRWHVFENFLEDMGLKPDGDLSIERKENDGHYNLDNCTWATRSEQINNRSI